MSKPKTCKKCGTKLSSYNPGPYCFAHTEGMPVKTHYPISKCWSRNEFSQFSSGRHLSGEGLLYDQQRLAFSESVTGVVIAGSVEPIEKIMGFK